MNSSATIKASGAPGGPGFDAGSTVIVNPDAHALTGVFAEADVMLGSNNYDYINFQAGGKAGKNNNILKYSFTFIFIIVLITFLGTLYSS
jgi:hypothetical protein